jgi:5-methylcytosine-specific restriction endonuclease McrA
MDSINDFDGEEKPSYLLSRKEYQKRFRTPKSEKAKERDRNYYQANRDKYLAKYKVVSWLIRARKFGSSGEITSEEWEKLKVFYNHTCLRCGRQEPSIELTLDHVRPLSKGGENKIGNAQPLCQHCNSKKGVKTIDYRPIIVSKI